MSIADLEVTLAEPSPIPADPSNAAVRRVRRRRPLLVIGAAMYLVLLSAAALLADVLPLSDPERNVGVQRLPPFHSWKEPLGTDRFGRSELARIIFGARVSLTAGVSATLLAFVVGVPLGVMAGYRRRGTDMAISLLTDTLLAFPGLVVLMAASALLKPGLSTIVIGLAIIALPSMVRLSRGNAMRVSQMEFVSAARVSGLRSRTIIMREILPNVAAPVGAYALAITAALIVAESSVSYLGLGVKATTPSWGSMIYAAQPDLARFPFLVGVPAAFLFLTVICISVVGDHLRKD